MLRWNEPSLRFYDGLGARRMEGWVGMRVDDLGGEGEGEVGGGEVGALERLAAGGKGVVWGEGRGGGERGGEGRGSGDGDV